jgi:hypothetical protein
MARDYLPGELIRASHINQITPDDGEIIVGGPDAPVRRPAADFDNAAPLAAIGVVSSNLSTFAGGHATAEDAAAAAVDANPVIAYTNPGSMGEDDEYLGWNGGAPVHLKIREVEPEHPRWGMVLNGNSADAVGNSAAFNAAAASLGTDGGVISLGPGTGYVNPVAHAVDTSQKAALWIGGKTRLQGAGMGATVLRLAGNQQAGDYKLIQNSGLSGGDTDITIADIELDGNAANNPGQLGNGLMLLRVRGVRIERVRARDFYGYDFVPPGETFQFATTLSTDVSFANCEAVGTAGNTASGFGDNASTNVTYAACLAYGMTFGNGFTSWHSRNVVTSDSHAYLNGAYGFNYEFCTDVLLTNSHAGGRASDMADGAAGVAADADLGNTSAGITSLATQRLVLSGVHSSDNGGPGVQIASADGIDSSVQINGGYYTANGAVGVTILHAGSVPGTFISRDAHLSGNTGSDLQLPVVGGVTNMNGLLPTPTVPASGVALTNPFPFAVTVYLVSTNTYFTSVNGVNLGFANGTFTITLQPGSTISANYGTAPTWLWYRA